MAITKKYSMDPEQELPSSRGPTYTRPWCKGSYSAKTGRAAGTEGGGQDAQIPSAGRHTQSPGTKRSTKPGRW